MPKILSKDNSPFGKDYYRGSNPSIPLAYQETIVHDCAMNKSGTNSNVNIRTLVPVVDSIDGRTSSTNAFSMRTHYTALQHVVADEERNRAFQEHIKFLVLAETSMKVGTLPDEPLNTEQSLKTVLEAYILTLA